MTRVPFALIVTAGLAASAHAQFVEIVPSVSQVNVAGGPVTVEFSMFLDNDGLSEFDLGPSGIQQFNGWTGLEGVFRLTDGSFVVMQETDADAAGGEVDIGPGGVGVVDPTDWFGRRPGSAAVMGSEAFVAASNSIVPVNGTDGSGGSVRFSTDSGTQELRDGGLTLGSETSLSGELRGVQAPSAVGGTDQNTSGRLEVFRGKVVFDSTDVGTQDIDFDGLATFFIESGLTGFTSIAIENRGGTIEVIDSPVVDAIDGDLREMTFPGLLLPGNTGFGDAISGDFIDTDGSEFNRITHSIENGILKLGIAGNLEDNFNKLEIFFDVAEGGQSKLRGDNPPANSPGLNRLGDDGSGNGLTLGSDAKPFDADYYMSYSLGDQGAGLERYLSLATLSDDGSGVWGFLGPIADANGVLTGPGLQDGTITAALDNSNTEGVGPYLPGLAECGDLDAAAAVDSGFEVEVSLAELGWDGQRAIKVSAVINSTLQGFLSNQFIDDAVLCIGTPANLGDPRNADLTSEARGNPFYTIHIPESVLPPEPASVADITTTGATQPGQPGFAEPDGNVDLDDLGYFLNFWLLGTP